MCKKACGIALGGLRKSTHGRGLNVLRPTPFGLRLAQNLVRKYRLFSSSLRTDGHLCSGTSL